MGEASHVESPPAAQATLKRPFSAVTVETNGSQRIVFNVGGTRFETTRATLDGFPPDSYVGRFLDPANRHLCKPDPDGSYFIDRDSRGFAAILSALRRSATPRMPYGMDRREWLDELTFWGMATKAQVRQEVEILGREHNFEQALRKEFLAQAKTIQHFLKDEVVQEKTKRLYVTSGVADKRFIEEQSASALGGDDFRLGFSWGDALRTRAVREFLYDMGIAVRLVSFKSVRIRCKHIKKSTLLWRLLGGCLPATTTLLVTKIEVTKPEPGSSFADFDGGTLDLEQIRQRRAPDGQRLDELDGDEEEEDLSSGGTSM